MSPVIASAAEQLRRLLLTIPRLDDDRAHPLGELAESIGCDERTLLGDLRTLVERNSPEPAGWYEPITLTLDADAVRLERPSYFRRPMVLTTDELRALDLALALLRQEAGPDEHGVIDETRTRIDQLSRVYSDALDTHAVHLGAHDEAAAARRRLLDECIAASCIAELDYQRAADAAPIARRVMPLGFVFASGTWYLVAGTVPDGSLRVFRADRISGVRRSEEQFSPPENFTLDSVLVGGRVFVGEVGESLRVRYSANIARWIAEREDLVPDADGSVTIEYPLADPEWALRHVLQYGADAQILAPVELREALRARLTSMLDA
jgi:predicted DNA-binding transcriptional regulator YafY